MTELFSTSGYLINKLLLQSLNVKLSVQSFKYFINYVFLKLHIFNTLIFNKLRPSERLCGCLSGLADPLRNQYFLNRFKQYFHIY